MQTLADLGVVGFALIAAVFFTALWVAFRGLRVRVTEATLALAWIVVVAGLWIAQGIVAGLAIDALTWLTFGLAAAGARG